MLHVIHLLIHNMKNHQTVVEEEGDNKESSKLLNSQYRECNDYFFQAYEKTCFEGKKYK